jgi:hypothetical protein
MVDDYRLSVVLNQERLVDFRVMYIDDRDIELLEFADEVLMYPILHFKPSLFFDFLHHLEERRNNLANFLCLGKIQRRWRHDCFVL